MITKETIRNSDNTGIAASTLCKRQTGTDYVCTPTAKVTVESVSEPQDQQGKY